MLLRGTNVYSVPSSYCSYTTLSPNIISDIHFNQTITEEDNTRGDITDILVPSVIYIAIRSIYILFVLLRW
jgi:hypothetical protein